MRTARDEWVDLGSGVFGMGHYWVSKWSACYGLDFDDDNISESIVQAFESYQAYREKHPETPDNASHLISAFVGRKARDVVFCRKQRKKPELGIDLDGIPIHDTQGDDSRVIETIGQLDEKLIPVAFAIAFDDHGIPSERDIADRLDLSNGTAHNRIVALRQSHPLQSLLALNLSD